MRTPPHFYVIGTVLVVLDFLIWILTFQFVPFLIRLARPKTLRSVSVGESEAGPRRNTLFKDQFTTTSYPNVSTVYELFKRSITTYKNSRCMGTRDFLGMQDVGEKFPVKLFGDTHWMTYEEAGERSFAIGSGLRAIGMTPQPEISPNQPFDDVKNQCTIGIYENTCAEWMCVCQGSFSQSLVVVTIYSTLGIDAVVCAVNEASISVLVCNRSSVKQVLKARNQMPSLKFIIYTEDTVEPELRGVPPVTEGLGNIKLMSVEELVKLGRQNSEQYPPSPPSPASIGVIMYTSGSTGKPKGVVVRHSQLVASIASLPAQLSLEGTQNVYIGYLPLAHILEMVAEFCILGLGSAIGYADPKTLTTSGCRPTGALEVFHPTLMAGVPKIWDIFAKAIKGKLSHAPPLSQFIFNLAYKVRLCALAQGRDTPLFNLLVFKKFTQIIGGHLQKAVSGGGPLSGDVQDFIRVCFGCILIQGYGLTEVCGASACQALDDYRNSVAGMPTGSVEIKLVSCLDENGEPSILDKQKQPYLAQDKRDHKGNPCLGRGEVWIRGPSIADGYFKMPDKTAEVFDSDGWFHSGDVGQWLPDGSLMIVDRVKNLVKLKGGEYIAIENMETIFGNSEFVDAIAGGVMVYGDGEMDRPVAIVQVSRPVVRKWATEHGIESKSDEDLVAEPKVQQAVLDSLNSEGKKAGLGTNEKLVAVHLLCEPWNVENKCLTATNKLSRRDIQERHHKELEELRKLGAR